MEKNVRLWEEGAGDNHRLGFPVRGRLEGYASAGSPPPVRSEFKAYIGVRFDVSDLQPLRSLPIILHCIGTFVALRSIKRNVHLYHIIIYNII